MFGASVVEGVGEGVGGKVVGEEQQEVELCSRKSRYSINRDGQILCVTLACSRETHLASTLYSIHEGLHTSCNLPKQAVVHLVNSSRGGLRFQELCVCVCVGGGGGGGDTIMTYGLLNLQRGGGGGANTPPPPPPPNCTPDSEQFAILCVQHILSTLWVWV